MAKKHEPERDAKQCPVCGEIYDRGANGHGGAAWSAEQVPHEDQTSCIRSLHARLEAVERTLERHNF